MSRNTRSVDFDFRQVEALAKDLGQLSGEEIGRVSVTALNDVIDSTYELARNRMNQGINLDDPYLRRRMEVRKATPARPVAEITAFGQNTTLSTYDAEVSTRAATSPVSRLKGYKTLGIPAGKRTNAVSVAVTRGSRKTVRSDNVFANEGIKDSQGRPLIMRRLEGQTRNGRARLQALLGPSPYQLFAAQMVPVSLAAEEQLEQRLVNDVGDLMQKAISK